MREFQIIEVLCEHGTEYHLHDDSDNCLFDCASPIDGVAWIVVNKVAEDFCTAERLGHAWFN